MMLRKKLVFLYLRAMKKYIGSILLMCSCVLIYGQSKEQLERQRTDIIKEIEKTNNYLKNTKKDKETTLKDVKAISDLVENRKDLVDNIKNELVASDAAIAKNSRAIDSLNTNYKQLSEQYASYLQRYYVMKLTNNKWTFLLSAQSLNTFLLRWRYLEQYEAFKNQKIIEISNLQSFITQKNKQIDVIKSQKSSLLASQQENIKKLESDKKLKDDILKKLSSKERELVTQLTQKQKEREKLNSAIERVILEQMKAVAAAEEAANAAKKAREKEKEKEKDTKTTTSTISAPSKPSEEEKFTAVTIKLSSNFSDNRGKLPWPISSGSISSRFGKQPHPTLKELTINNNGIDIQSNSPQPVLSVFEGEVVSINNIPGTKTMVILKHGSFFTVYSYLESVSVSKGQSVKAGTTLGTTGINDEGKAEVHFELWKDKSKQNPESWLKGK